MSKIVHQSRITITREKGPTRRAEIEGFAEPVYYGVHGGIKKFYNVTPEEEHAATLDHIVGAVGGWMMGTLASVMAKKKIRTFQDRFMAKVTGDIEDVGGILKITRIDVRYFLKLPDRQREEAVESFNNYIEFCPAAQSVIGCIAINHNLEMEKLEDWYQLSSDQGSKPLAAAYYLKEDIRQLWLQKDSAAAVSFLVHPEETFLNEFWMSTEVMRLTI